MPSLDNFGELGYIIFQCNKPRRMERDRYSFSIKFPKSSKDYGIEIKGDIKELVDW